LISIILWTVQTNSLPNTTEYPISTTTDTQMVDDLSWPIFGIIFGIMIGISASGLFYWIHATYFLYRRYKYGISSYATVICREVQEYPGAKERTAKYHVKYVYTDRRIEITEKCIYHLIRWYISTYYNNNHPITIDNQSTSNLDLDYIPTDIQNIIYSYLHNSIVFWYGPYEIESIVSESLYRESYTGSKVDIKYDPHYPKNCELFLEPIWHSFWYWIRWFGGFLCSISGCIFFSFIISPKLKQIHYRPLLIIIIACALSMLSISILSTLWFKGSGCFRRIVKGKLKFVQFGDEINQSAAGICYNCAHPELNGEDDESATCECEAGIPGSNDSNKIHEFIHKNELLYEQCRETNIVYVQTNMELSPSLSTSPSNILNY